MSAQGVDTDHSLPMNASGAFHALVPATRLSLPDKTRDKPKSISFTLGLGVAASTITLESLMSPCTIEGDCECKYSKAADTS